MRNLSRKVSGGDSTTVAWPSPVSLDAETAKVVPRSL